MNLKVDVTEVLVRNYGHIMTAELEGVNQSDVEDALIEEIGHDGILGLVSNEAIITYLSNQGYNIT